MNVTPMQKAKAIVWAVCSISTWISVLAVLWVSYAKGYITVTIMFLFFVISIIIIATLVSDKKEPSQAVGWKKNE